MKAICIAGVGQGRPRARDRAGARRRQGLRRRLHWRLGGRGRRRLPTDHPGCGHTFINPTYGDLSTLWHVYVVDLPTMAVRDYHLQAGILDVQVTDQNLFLLGILNEDFSHPLVKTYALSDMTRTSSTALTRPADDYYVAALFTP